MRPKSKYSVDRNNRLVVSKNRKNLPVNGSFSIDKHNRLIYLLNESPHWKAKHQLPKRLVFTGNWRLDQNYYLELELAQFGAGVQRDTLILRGEIISCENDKLVFSLKSTDANGLTRLQLLKLNGTWKADEVNQIYFAVNKKASPDILAFEGAWHLNQHQQVIYNYEKTRLKRKDKVISTLTFRGYWQMGSANRLTYILSGGGDSKFDFKAQIESPTLYPAEGVIRYRLGAGVKKAKPAGQKVVCLYGTWNLSHKLGLSFEIEQGKGQRYSLVFAAEANFIKNNRVVFNLKNPQGDDIGISVVFTHRFLKQLDAEFFLRLKRLQKDSSIDAGIRIPF